jgi:hypothetical protein
MSAPKQTVEVSARLFRYAWIHTQNAMAITEPPSPDRTHSPRYVNWSVLECVYSADLKHRAVLARDNRGNVHVCCEMWDVSDWAECGRAFWCPVGRGGTITDTI